MHMHFFQENFTEYKGVGPETPSRILHILKEVDGEEVPLDKESAETAIKKVHLHFDEFSEYTRESKQQHPDLYFEPSLYNVALCAINTAITAAKNKGMAIIRPPGHHAGKNMEGFCYFNNLIIACETVFPNKKIAIIDFDAHYGNGTHQLVKNNERYFFASIHANTKHYPITRYHTKNSYLIDVDPEKTDDDLFLNYIKKIIEKIKKFEPDILAISAGFDSWHRDPVLPYAIKNKETYKKIGEKLRSLKIDSFGVLEGGYSKELGILYKEFTKGLFGEKQEDAKVSKAILEFNKKEGRKYLLNEKGELLEVETKVKKIASINRKPEHHYEIIKNKVIEKKIKYLDLDEFYRKKEDGSLAKLYSKGYEVKINENSLTLKQVKELQEQQIIKDLKGKTIEDVEITKNKKKEIVIKLSDGHKIVLREGLLRDSYLLEIE